jgi:four helix bundle protein
MFRFQTLDIWRRSIDVAEDLFDLADELDSRKLFHFVEQLRDAALSMSNDIAEGSGSPSIREFAQFINIAKRSVFENANMVIIFERRKYITPNRKEKSLTQLDELSRMMTSFRRSLNA